MIRKFNYTVRKKIEKSNIHIRLIRDTTPYPYFDMKISISPEDFPEDSELFVEAYDCTSFMRFKCGTLKNPQYPEYCHLTEIHTTDSIMFRVKQWIPQPSTAKFWVSQTAFHLLEKVRRTQSTLPCYPSHMTISGKKSGNWISGIRAVLVLNNKIESVPVTELVRSNELFFSLVYPPVLCEILSGGTGY